MDQSGWGRLADASKRFADYQYIEVPWMVPLAVSMETCPSEDYLYVLTDGQTLVGSGEQGFIKLMRDGLLPAGRYQTITPCFRNEVVLDETHRSSFMKLELIDTTGDADALERMLYGAQGVMFDMGVSTNVVVEVGDGIRTLDLVDPFGVELGSYGERTTKDQQHSWVFGTGLAEPRFGISLDRVNQ